MTTTYEAFLASTDENERWKIVQTFWDKLGGTSYQGYPDIDEPGTEEKFRFSVHVQGVELDLSDTSFFDVTTFLMALTHQGLPDFKAATAYLQSEARP